MQSIFNDKNVQPNQSMLEQVLGQESYGIWNEITEYVLQKDKSYTFNWKFASAKFGWSCRISDKKRVIIYLLPRDKFFKIAMVFGDKACQQIYDSNIDQSIKTLLQEATNNAEGKGIRIDIRNSELIESIYMMIDIKVLKN